MITKKIRHEIRKKERKKKNHLLVVVLNFPHGIAKTAPKRLDGDSLITQNNTILLHIMDASYARTKRKKKKERL